MSRKYLTLIEPEALDKWLKARCQEAKTNPEAFKAHADHVFDKYDGLVRIAANHVANEQQFIGASAMIIAILELLEQKSKEAS